MRIVPSIPLLTTSTTIAAPYWTAVASSWPLIRKSPSPERQTTGPLRAEQLRGDRGRDAVAHRAGARRELRAVAVELVEPVRPHRVVAGAVREHRVVGQPLAQVGHHLGELERRPGAGRAGGSRGSRRAPARPSAARARRRPGGAPPRTAASRRRSPARPRRRGRARPGRRGRGSASGAGAAARAASTAASRSRRGACRAQGSRRRPGRAGRASGPCPIVSGPGVRPAKRCRRSPGGGTRRRPARSTPRRTRSRRGRACSLQPPPPTTISGRSARRAARARARRRPRPARPAPGGSGAASATSASSAWTSSGQRDHDRPGPARGRRVERVRDELGHRRGVVDRRHPLRHLAEHARVVELLERLAAEVARAAPGRRRGRAASSPGRRCGRRPRRASRRARA